MMKNALLFLLLVFLFSCKKDDDIPTSIPDGYYDYTLTYNNGVGEKVGVVKLTKISEVRLIIDDGASPDTLNLLDDRISGIFGLKLAGAYLLDGAWSYDKKTKVNLISGTFSEKAFGMGGQITYYYYGTFTMTKAD